MSWRTPNDLERFLLADTRDRWPEIIPLACLLVLAPRIEPLLLRNARQHFLPTTGAELESQLWFSSLVAARSSREIVLHLGVACVLAGQLGGARRCPGAVSEKAEVEDSEPPPIEAVWEFTRDHTRHWPAEDRLERDLRYHALRDDDTALNEGLQAILARIAAEFDPTLDGASVEQRRIGLARLAKRTLPSLRASLGERSANTARLLARYAALALGDGGDWSAAPLGAPDALPAWLNDRLPPALAQARLGIEVRSDGSDQQILHLVEPPSEGPVIDLPSPLPGRLHVAPGGRVGAWHPANIGSRIRVDPPSATLRLSTLDGRQWELATERPEETAAEEARSPLILIHAEADLEQAQAIAGWLRGQGIAVELIAEKTGSPTNPSTSPTRTVRLWTQAARMLWAESTPESDQQAQQGLLLRTESVQPPSAGVTKGHLLDWQDWRHLADSPQAAGLAQMIGQWWRAGEIPVRRTKTPSNDSGGTDSAEVLDSEIGEGSGDAPTPSTEAARAAEIERLLEEIADPKTEPPRRLAIGDRLAELGDPRPGVGIIEIEVPIEASSPTETITEPNVTPEVIATEFHLSPEIDKLLAEIADPSTEPPQRLEIGDALARLGDPRPGVGLRPDGLPDIAWIEIPSGTFIYQDGETRELPTFWIARYPVTNAQYQVFIDDGGYRESHWWKRLKRPKPEAPRWPQVNRPRTNVDWHEAVAFTRWLNARLGLPEGRLRLPSELEWEKAARGVLGRAYPWGDAYQSGLANVDETRVSSAGKWYLGQTTAVGVYPHGRSPYDVDDLSGNVWEWCLNKYDDLEAIAPDKTGNWRALRGGSWFLNPDYARVGYRRRYYPVSRNDGRGFRLLLSVPIAPVR